MESLVNDPSSSFLGTSTPTSFSPKNLAIGPCITDWAGLGVMVQGIQRQMGRCLLVGGLWVAIVVFAASLRKEIYVGLWEWWIW